MDVKAMLLTGAFTAAIWGISSFFVADMSRPFGEKLNPSKLKSVRRAGIAFTILLILGAGWPR